MKGDAGEEAPEVAKTAWRSGGEVRCGAAAAAKAGTATLRARDAIGARANAAGGRELTCTDGSEGPPVGRM